VRCARRIRRIRSGFSVNSRASRRLCHESTAKDHRLHRNQRRRLHRQARRRCRMAKSPTAHSRLRHARVLPLRSTPSCGDARPTTGVLPIPRRKVRKAGCSTGSSPTKCSSYVLKNITRMLRPFISEPRRDRGPADNCAVASKTATRSTWLPGRNVCREKRVDDIPLSIFGGDQMKPRSICLKDYDRNRRLSRASTGQPRKE